MKISVFLWAMLIVSVSAMAQQKPFVLQVSGEVLSPLQLSVQDIAVMPHETVHVNDKSGKPHEYRGVAVQYILAKAGVTLGKELRGENLSKYVLAKCADGYEVVYSLAELDSSFVKDIPIVADTADGKPLPDVKGPLRIIMPGDKKPARSCFQLVELVVRFAKE